MANPQVSRNATRSPSESGSNTPGIDHPSPPGAGGQSAAGDGCDGVEAVLSGAIVMASR